MKRNMIYVLYVLLATFAFTLPFIRGNREINLDTLKKPLAPYMTNMEKKDAAWVYKQCHLDNAAYKQALIYGTASAMEVSEVAVLKQTDKTKQEALQKLCQERADRQLKNLQGHTSRQSALLEKTAVYENGHYVAVLIHPQQSQLRQLLKRA